MIGVPARTTPQDPAQGTQTRKCPRGPRFIIKVVFLHFHKEPLPRGGPPNLNHGKHQNTAPRIPGCHPTDTTIAHATKSTCLCLFTLIPHPAPIIITISFTPQLRWMPPLGSSSCPILNGPRPSTLRSRTSSSSRPRVSPRMYGLSSPAMRPSFPYSYS